MHRKHHRRNDSNERSHSRGGLGKKVLALVDLIHRETQSVQKRQERAQELLEYLKQTDRDHSMEKAVWVCLSGGKGLEPLLQVFKSELVTEKFLRTISECLGQMVYFYKRSPNSRYSTDEEEFVHFFISKIKSCTGRNSLTEKHWLWETLEQILIEYNNLIPEGPESVPQGIMQRLLPFLEQPQDLSPKFMDVLLCLGQMNDSVMEQALASVLWGLVNWSLMQTAKTTVHLIRNTILGLSVYLYEDSLIYTVESLLTFLTKNLMEMDKKKQNALLILGVYQSLVESMTKACFVHLNKDAVPYMHYNPMLYSQFMEKLYWMFEQLQEIPYSEPWSQAVLLFIKTVFKALKKDIGILEQPSVNIIVKYSQQIVQNYLQSNEPSEMVQFLSNLQDLMLEWPLPLGEQLRLMFFGKESFYFNELRQIASEHPQLLNAFVLFSQTCFQLGSKIQQLEHEHSLLAEIKELFQDQSNKKKLGLNLKLIHSMGDGTVLGLHPASAFRELSQMHQLHVRRFESNLLQALMTISINNGFFLPPIVYTPVQKYDFIDILEFQYQLIFQLLDPKNLFHLNIGLDWLLSMIDYTGDKNLLDTDVKDSMVLSQMEQLLLKAIDVIGIVQDPLARVKIGQAWQKYLMFFSRNRRGHPSTPVLIQKILSRRFDIDVRVRQQFMIVQSLIDPFDSLMAQKSVEEDPLLNEFKLLVIQSHASGVFGLRQFQIVCNYLGMRMSQGDIQLRYCTRTESLPEQWLPRMFHHCRGPAMLGRSDAVTSGMLSLDTLFFWAFWETSRLLIHYRLKTPFGGPLQTLETLETAIDHLVEQAEQNHVFVERLRHLLLLIEVLEMQITNTATGSFHSNAYPSKSAILFFYSNLKTCQDWFNRIRKRLEHGSRMTNLDSLQIKSSFGILQECLKQLQENQSNGQTMTQSLISIYEALIRTRDVDQLIGLSTYWAKSIPMDLVQERNRSTIEISHFLLGLGYMVQGKMEKALAMFEHLLPRLESNQLLKSEIQKYVLECYIQLNDPQSLQSLYSLQSTARDDNQNEQERASVYLKKWDIPEPTLAWKDGISDGWNGYCRQLFYAAQERLSFDQLSEKMIPLQPIYQSLGFNAVQEDVHNLLWLQTYGTLLQQKSSGIRVAKVKPKEGIMAADIPGSQLSKWIELYDAHYDKNPRIQSVYDPDLDEIRAVLAENARMHENLKLANRLLPTSIVQNALTLSGQLRNTLKKAQLLYDQQQPTRAIQMLLDHFQTPGHDQEQFAKAYHLLAQWKNAHLELKPEFEDPNALERHYLKKSTEIAPDYYKSWNKWAAYCYKGMETDDLELVSESALAYFNYLRTLKEKKSARRSTVKRSQVHAITACLRLVKILCKYGESIQVFDNLESTPLDHWKLITPQLLSRLHHPNPFVRQELTKLLCRIGASYPHLVLYPTTLNLSFEKVQQEEYQKIADILKRNNPLQMKEMHRWILELQRITVLWDELWLHTLEHIQVDAVSRLDRLGQDIARIKSNKLLTEQESQEIIETTSFNTMKPIIFSLERLCERTIKKPATSLVEKEFKNKYEQTILNALEGLEQIHLDKPRNVWKPFHKLIQDLNLLTSKPRSFELKDVSPFLSRIKDSHVPMPGDTTETVYECGSTVLTLPSKTKPKKIEFHSSDGSRHLYLLKGHEDLHLDERVQQFIRMCNLLLEGDLESSERNLKARCYGVLPFGDNFGMIQWIDKSTGLFPIYRKWSLWDLNCKQLKKEKTVQMRPQDKFTEKIQKAIEDNVIQKKTPRHQWPMDLLLTIHRQLKQETPQDLVYKELWTTSLNPMTLLKKQAVFARSLGVMSMIGHILGLGDRHLDNILLDIQTGEIIHIDFNVCFDKGKRLRVPETVPFRLTQNLVHCLGFTGVEGKFRIACEHALSVMQQSSEMLIVLLEAFLYDPLVDWTSSHSERRLMHLNANLGLLSSRMNEQRPYLQDLQSKLVDASNDIHKWHSKWQSNSEKYQMLQQSMEIGLENEPQFLESLDQEIQTQMDSIYEIAIECSEWNKEHESIHELKSQDPKTQQKLEWYQSMIAPFRSVVLEQDTCLRVSQVLLKLCDCGFQPSVVQETLAHLNLEPPLIPDHKFELDSLEEWLVPSSVKLDQKQQFLSKIYHGLDQPMRLIDPLLLRLGKQEYKDLPFDCTLLLVYDILVKLVLVGQPFRDYLPLSQLQQLQSRILLLKQTTHDLVSILLKQSQLRAQSKLPHLKTRQEWMDLMEYLDPKHTELQSLGQLMQHLLESFTEFDVVLFNNDQSEMIYAPNELQRQDSITTALNQIVSRDIADPFKQIIKSLLTLREKSDFDLSVLTRSCGYLVAQDLARFQEQQKRIHDQVRFLNPSNDFVKTMRDSLDPQLQLIVRFEDFRPDRPLAKELLQKTRSLLESLLKNQTIAQKIKSSGFVSASMEDLLEQMDSLGIPELRILLLNLIHNLDDHLTKLKIVFEPIQGVLDNVLKIHDVDPILQTCRQSFTDISNLQLQLKHLTESEMELQVLMQTMQLLEQQMRVFFDSLLQMNDLQIESNETVQEQNQYAVEILSRIKQKLETKDAVVDQVDKLIYEASDEKRLASMFEGWMSWI